MERSTLFLLQNLKEDNTTKEGLYDSIFFSQNYVCITAVHYLKNNNFKGLNEIIDYLLYFTTSLKQVIHYLYTTCARCKV